MLLNYHNMKHSATNVSPAEALMSRRLQTRLPNLQKHLLPGDPDHAAIRKSDMHAKQGYKHYYDRHHGARSLPALELGQPVLTKLDTDKAWTKSGVVIKRDAENRTYLIETSQGQMRRNRQHLLPVQELPYQGPAAPEDILFDPVPATTITPVNDPQPQSSAPSPTPKPTRIPTTTV